MGWEKVCFVDDGTVRAKARNNRNAAIAAGGRAVDDLRRRLVRRQARSERQGQDGEESGEDALGVLHL